MKIAFASCMCTSAFKNQPVWEEVAAQQPDYIVLLGDSVYLDINVPASGLPQPGEDNTPVAMSPERFANHVVGRYRELLAQKQFRGLIAQMQKNSVFSIWDDHDFLWNDACGSDIAANPQQKEKIAISTACQSEYRKALANCLQDDQFPADLTALKPLLSQAVPLPTPSIQLKGNVWLHLLDVRTFRTQTFRVKEAARTIIGAAQRLRISKAVANAPEAIHLLATGSTIGDWQKYRCDYEWLLNLATAYRCAALTGDIHRNEVNAFFRSGFPLHEFTSSGAAVKDAVIVGKKQQNFGLLEIDDNFLRVRFFHFGQEETSLSRSYLLSTWLPT